MFGRTRLIVIVYLVIGVIVAASKDYFDGIDNIEGVISAALGVVLWPLLLLDVNLRIGGPGYRAAGPRAAGPGPRDEIHPRQDQEPPDIYGSNGTTLGLL